MADNVLVGDNRVSEGEDGHLSLTLAAPDLNLSQGWLIELFWSRYDCAGLYRVTELMTHT